MTPFSNSGGDDPGNKGSSKVVSAAVLRNRMESELLRSVLSERGIPHVLIIHDTMWGEGIFNVREGWGHIEAPSEYRSEIEEIYGDLFSGKGEQVSDGDFPGPEE